MILGVGTDLCDMRRIARAIERLGGRFLERSFTCGERAYADTRTGDGRLGILAKRWAAKEAFVKALGTGFTDGLHLVDIEVIKGVRGRPSFLFHNRAIELVSALAEPLHRIDVQLSLSDETPYAIAYVVIQSIPDDVQVVLRDRVSPNSF